MMKWLFLVLLGANVGFFAWHQTRDLPNGGSLAQVQPPSAAGKPLTLVSETTSAGTDPTVTRKEPPAAVGTSTSKPPVQVSEPRQEPPTVTKPPEPSPRPADLPEKEEIRSKPTPTAPQAVSRCFQVSEIESEDARERFAAAVQKLGGQVSARGTSRSEQSRFWVMLPPFPSAEAAAPVLQRLKERGETDYYFIRSGENRFAISLGVFSTRDIAERRMRQMRDSGLQPELRPVGFTAVRYRLDVSFKKDPPGSWQSHLPYGAALETRSCK